jgi:hypothetical protein
MGMTVAEYFAQKRACGHCEDHGTEDYCETTLLSRDENCIMYNVYDHLDGITREGIAALQAMRETQTEERRVDYYVRCEKIIMAVGMQKMTPARRNDMLTYFNELYVKDIVAACLAKEYVKANDLVEHMLVSLERDLQAIKTEANK